MRIFFACALLSCTLFSFCKASFTQGEDFMLELSTYSTEQVAPLLPLLQDWGVREFVRYPYLWVPPQDEIFEAYALLAEEKNSLVTLVKHQGKVIAVAAGVPFDAERLHALFDGKDTEVHLEPSVLQRVRQMGFDPSQIFYMSYFLTAPEYRNDKHLVELIYDKYVQFIRSIGKSQICYFDDLGRADHPLKPENPAPIEPWGVVLHGFRSMHVKKEFSWPTVQQDGSVKDEIHHLEFFVKDV